MSAYWTLLGIFVILLGVTIRASSGRRSAAFVFTDFEFSTGWISSWAFFLGLLPQAYTYAGIGMIASMAEEVKSPATDVPQAMIWSVPIGFITGVLFLLPILFTLPDIPALINDPSDQPIGIMFELMMGSKAAAFAMWFIIFGVGLFCTVSICCASSRATWAFARDKAIPFYAHFSQLNSYNIPFNAYILSTGIQLLLGLIFLGSSTAFNAFVGVAVLSLGASYAMPIAISLLNGRRAVTDSPFYLGKAGFILNSFAVLWVLFEIVLFSLPLDIPVTAVSMNYASAVFIGFAALSMMWYFLSGRFTYAGPIEVIEMNELRT